MEWAEEKEETGPGPPQPPSTVQKPGTSQRLNQEEDLAVHVVSTVLQETSLVGTFALFPYVGGGRSERARGLCGGLCLSRDPGVKS